MSDLIKTGEVFSGCKILSQCGKGAYGVVYLAENTIGEKLVIKVVESTKNSDRELKGLRNYMTICREQPALLQIFHIGETENGFYYTMEAADDIGADGAYLPATLGNLMRQGKSFALEDAIRIIRELLEDLKIIHQAGLIHRDIKPDNIIFIRGKAKLSDPGLVSKFNRRTTLVGTPGFIPPELLLRNLPVDSASDLYALGKVFYCMVSGDQPEEYPHLSTDIPIAIRRQVFPALSRMCNVNPEKRCRTADEFGETLPKTVRPANFYERSWQSFQDWKNLNREYFRFLAGSGILLVILLLAAGGGVFWHQKQQKEKLLIQEQKVRKFLAVNSKRRDLLAFQIENNLPGMLSDYKKNSEELQNALQNGAWEKAVFYTEKLSGLLKGGAEKLLPSIPDKEGDFQQDSALIGRAYGFLASPLWAYLPPEKQENFKRRLSRFDSLCYQGRGGPRCGREWSDLQNSFYDMVFLPPGVVKMDHNGKKISIPYHFWMAKNEVGHAIFVRLTGCAPQRSPHTGTPVERVLWNDVLHFSLFLTNVLKAKNYLPPGYIVRPPTEAEWEYAAKNAYLQNEELPLEKRAVYRENSEKRSWPSGSKAPGKLGIYDLYGNVSEIVLNTEKTKMKHAVIVRGGSFRSLQKNLLNYRVELQKYQNIPYDIGFRIVIAPGDMSYFDKHFFLGGSNTLRSHGRVFELLGENYGTFDRARAEQLCRLLGGKLAELDSPGLLKKVIEEMPLAASSWGCLLGGEKIKDKWYWSSSKKEVFQGKWYKKDRENEKYLALQSKKWSSVSSRFRTGIFLCQWDEKEFPDRNRQLRSNKKLPAELLRFSVGSRRFMLISSRMAWYTARRFCELLGGRLACLDTPEIQQAVIKKLEKFSSERILLGGYAKYENWFWLSGKEVITPLKMDKDMIIPTLNRNFVTLKNGELYNSQYSDLLLCEWLEK